MRGARMQKKIAITGGIGCGKSLVAKYVAEMGYPIFSCDEINRNLLTDPDYIERIKNVFPNCVNDGKIDKNTLKNTVFCDKKALKWLNDIAHPVIMTRLFSAMKKSDSEFVFAEVPLLFEGGYERDFDAIIIIKRDINERIKAVQQRDGLSEEEIKNRIAAQFDYTNLEKRIQNMNVHIIENEGDPPAGALQRMLTPRFDQDE